MPQSRLLKRGLVALTNRLALRPHAGDIGIGLIGVGGWGAANAASLMRTKRFDVRAVSDVSSEAMEKFTRRFATQSHERAEELLERTDLAAVAISVPTPHHAGLVRMAADAGLHVFVEKPLATTSQICRVLGRHCAERGVKLMVGHQFRREPALRALARRVEDVSHCGRPLRIRALRTRPRPRGEWRLDPQACRGGSMEELGIHLVDAMISIFGPVVRGSGWCSNIPPERPGPDWGHLELSFRDGLQGSVDAGFSGPDELQFDVYCEGVLLRLDGHGLIEVSAEGNSRIPSPGRPASVAQFDGFADCIEGSATPLTGAEASAQALEAIETMWPHGPPVLPELGGNAVRKPSVPG